MLDDNLPCQVARTQKGQLTEKPPGRWNICIFWIKDFFIYPRGTWQVPFYSFVKSPINLWWLQGFQEGEGMVKVGLLFVCFLPLSWTLIQIGLFTFLLVIIGFEIIKMLQVIGKNAALHFKASKHPSAEFC